MLQPSEPTQDIDVNTTVDKPNQEQQRFLDAALLARTTGSKRPLRLAGGPGVGKSKCIGWVARAAADDGWCTLLVGPTHQATGVLAAALRDRAEPYEPDPDMMLRAGDIFYSTAHRLAKWVLRSRARGAAAGETDPLPRTSWLGRALRVSWRDRPKGVLIICDETSMYHEAMVQALRTVWTTLRDQGTDTVFVAVGDPNQLCPVRGASYTLAPGEGPDDPSSLVTGTGFEHFTLTENMRAKDPALRNVVETYLHEKRVPIPGADAGNAYGWAQQSDDLFRRWAEAVEAFGTKNCIALAYRRAVVAHANDRLSERIDGCPSYALHEGRMMRVQETYAPRNETLAASSDLLRLDAVREVEDVADLILPPFKGHNAAHDPETLVILRELIATDLSVNGPYPVVDVTVFGDRAGALRSLPVSVAVEHTGAIAPSAARWAALMGDISHAAFRRSHNNPTIKRGLAAIFYHLSDSAMLKLEAPYAMTSHRAQGSTYPHVLVLADGQTGGWIVDHRRDSERNSSTYVMLSRASESLTIAWAPKPEPLIPGARFTF